MPMPMVAANETLFHEFDMTMNQTETIQDTPGCQSLQLQRASGPDPSRLRFWSTGVAFFAVLSMNTVFALLGPDDFESIGVLDLQDGEYEIDTTGPVPVLTEAASGTVLFSGVIHEQGIPASSPFHGWNPDVAVFSFDEILIDTNATITAHGPNPLALLAKGKLVLNGTLDAGGRPGENATGNLGGDEDGIGGRGGPGAGKGGDGGTGSPPTSTKGEDGAGPGGEHAMGAFGGFGGLSTRGNGAGFGGRGGGGFGGLVESSNYGDLRRYLQGGAGGGGTGTDLFLTKGAGGGGGGGGVELGAGDAVTIRGAVLAHGGQGGGGGTALAGGGSGGGVIVHAPTVAMEGGGALINANGGLPNGAGGRVLVVNGGRTPVAGTIVVNHGATGGERGVIEFGNPDFTIRRVAAEVDGETARNVQLEWNTLPGDTYRIHAASEVLQAGIGTWTPIGDPIVGDGNRAVSVHAIQFPVRMFRLEIIR